MAFAEAFLGVDPVVDDKALFVRYNGQSVSLVARTGPRHATLRIPRDEYVQVQVLRVDRVKHILYARPHICSKSFAELNNAMSIYDATEHPAQIDVDKINTRDVYFVKKSGHGIRAVILDREENSSHCMIYSIDEGLMELVEMSKIFELPESLRSAPPMCIAISIPSCEAIGECDEFKLLNEDDSCICKCDSRQSCSRRLQELYPPVLNSRVYLSSTDQSCFAELICSNTPRKDAIVIMDPVRKADLTEFSYSQYESVSNADLSRFYRSRRQRRYSNSRGSVIQGIPRPLSFDFTFKPFATGLPYRLTARVTERLDYDTYQMRDTVLLSALYHHISYPTQRVPMVLNGRKEFACIARAVRPGKANSLRASSRLYRAVANSLEGESDVCSVRLIDYGECIRCETSMLFTLNDQPPIVLDTPAASFTCHIKKVTLARKTIARSIKLEHEHEYSLILTSKYDEDSYWSTVSLSAPVRPHLVKRLMENTLQRETYGPMYHTAMQGWERNEDGPCLKENTCEEKSRHDDMNQEELIRKEEYINREQEKQELEKCKAQLASILTQLQLDNLSRRLDLLTTSASCYLQNFLPNSASTFASNGNGFVGVTQCPNGYNQYVAPLQQQQQPEIHHLAGLQSPYPTVPYPLMVPDLIRHQQIQQMLLNQGNPGFVYYGGFDGSQGPTATGYNPPSQLISPGFSQSVPPGVPFSNEQGEYSSSANRENRNPAALNEQEKADRLCEAQQINNQVDQDPSANGDIKDVIPTHPPYDTGVLSPTLSPIVHPATESELCLPCSAASDALHQHRRLDYGEPPPCFLSQFLEMGKYKSQRKQQPVSGLPETNTNAYVLCHNSGFDNSLLCASSTSSTRSENRFTLEFKKTSTPTAKIAPRRPNNEVKTFYVAKPRNADGEVLYTSDESSADETVEHSDSYESTNTKSYGASKIKDDLDISSCVDLRSIERSLKYIPFVAHFELAIGTKHVVKRSDDDNQDDNWPLFFVHPVEDDFLGYISEYLDSLTADYPLVDEDLKVGTLCISRCQAFQAKFRAVVTCLHSEYTEVHYIDYGNYEKVAREDLYSLNDQPEEVRTHPAMAVPCMIASLEDLKTSSSKNFSNEDVLKKMVSCSKPHFTVKIIRERSDGVCLVDIIE